MSLDVVRTEIAEILPLRELHRHAMRCQIIHDSFPQRGLSDPYLMHVDGRIAGYGLVSNKYDPDMVDEFYVLPAYRAAALPLFQQFLDVSAATAIRAQTNDRLLLTMLYDCATNITAANVLFEDGFTSQLTCPDGVLRKQPDAEGVDWQIDCGGEVVATGGVLFHYNPPFGDLHMNVDEAHRRRGFGSFLVQELKRICYETGHVPAARCNADNVISRKTLQKAGMVVCGRILQGEVARADRKD